MQRYPIVVLVGPSGGGKTALLLEMLKRFPDLCAPIKSKVTRAQRNLQDGIFYDFITNEDFEDMRASGGLFQTAYFGGHHYGCDREQTNVVITERIGLVVLVQKSVADFQAAGYKLFLIEIIPEGHKPRNDAERLRDDAERAKIELRYDAKITNSFAPGGFKKAAAELANILQTIKKGASPLG